MLFCDSRVKSLLKYPIFLETVDISCELKTSDLSDDKQFNSEIDLFEFYDIEKTCKFEEKMRKTLNDWNKINKKIV